MQHENTFDNTKPLEYNEGQQSVSCCNGTSISCPSLYLTFEQAKQKFLDDGMSPEDFENLMGFFKGLTQQLIDEEIRTITRNKHHNSND